MTHVSASPDQLITHVGLGAFFRAHQAWYTQLSNEISQSPWRIHALTGRRPDQAELLNAQGCRYSLIERGPDGDRAVDITSIVAASPGAEPEHYQGALADSRVAIVTTTITEKGYLLADGDGDRISAGETPQSAIGRLVDGLRHRWQTTAAPVAIVPCDNLTANGRYTRQVVMSLAQELEEDFSSWLENSVSFVSTMVDRITPATTATDIVDAQALVGWPDHAPVVAEPFSEWILAGDFPAGRPAWEGAGAVVTDDVEPYEQRKLWLLNGAHSAMAYVGLAHGVTTVAEAMEHPVCQEIVQHIWSDAAPCLPFSAAEIDQATAALTDRFTNARIRHFLAQIAGDGSQKLPVRLVAVQRARLAAGLGIGTAFAPVIAAWLRHLGSDAVNDPQVAGLRETLAHTADARDRARLVLQFLAPELAESDELTAGIAELSRGGAS